LEPKKKIPYTPDLHMNFKFEKKKLFLPEIFPHVFFVINFIHDDAAVEVVGAAGFFPFAGAFLAAGVFLAAVFFGLFDFVGDFLAAGFFGEAAFFGEAGFFAGAERFGAAFFVTFDGVAPAPDEPAVVAAAVDGAAAVFVVVVFLALAGDFGLAADFGFLTVFGFGDPALATVFFTFLTVFPPSVGFLSPTRKLPAAPIPFACFKAPVVTPRFNATFKRELTDFASLPTLKLAIIYFNKA